MDIATIIGTLLGFSLIVGSIIIGGGAAMFLHIPSIAITIGGMLCATMIHFSLPQFLSIFAIIKKTIIAKIPSQAELVQKMVNFAAINRRDGTLALEPEMAVYAPARAMHRIDVGPDEDLTYVLIYAPPGPEQQLKKGGEHAFDPK